MKSSKRVVLACLVLVGLSGPPLSAGTFTCTTNASGDDVLAWQGARTTPPRTSQQVVDSLLLGAIDTLRAEQAQGERRDVANDVKACIEQQKAFRVSRAPQTRRLVSVCE